MSENFETWSDVRYWNRPDIKFLTEVEIQDKIRAKMQIAKTMQIKTETKTKFERHVAIQVKPDFEPEVKKEVKRDFKKETKKETKRKVEKEIKIDLKTNLKRENVKDGAPDFRNLQWTFFDTWFQQNKTITYDEKLYKSTISLQYNDPKYQFMYTKLAKQVTLDNKLKVDRDIVVSNNKSQKTRYSSNSGLFVVFTTVPQDKNLVQMDCPTAQYLKLWLEIYREKSRRFAWIPVSFDHELEKSKSTHAGLAVFDTLLEEVFIFDPNGRPVYISDTLVDSLFKEVAQSIQYKYLPFNGWSQDKFQALNIKSEISFEFGCCYQWCILLGIILAEAEPMCDVPDSAAVVFRHFCNIFNTLFDKQGRTSFLSNFQCNLSDKMNTF